MNARALIALCLAGCATGHAPAPTPAGEPAAVGLSSSTLSSPQPATPRAAPESAPRVAQELSAPAVDTAPAAVALTGLGPHTRVVSQASAEAQRWFDQGLNLVFGFNHDESIKAFARAAADSPSCAMCFWGVAYANGPHINNPAVPADHAAAAVAALHQARAAAAKATPVEQALIEALALRYADPQPADRGPLDLAYAGAMRGVRKAFPADADVAALTAEALMDLHPWDLDEHDGRPKAWTGEIVAAAEAALALDPRNPLANHLYIHAVEGSRTPGRAAHAADTLRDLQPGLGHMVHMPSHIDVRTGHWASAIEANRRAIEADRRYTQLVPRQGFYALYMMHNHQMLAYAALMAGRSQEALSAAREMVKGIPPGFLKEATPFVDGYFALPLEVLLRFGRWDEILAEPDFSDTLPASRSLRHAARGLAFAAKGEPGLAREEQRAFEAARAQVPPSFAMGQNPVSNVLAIAGHLLEGELLYRAGRERAGIKELRRAVSAEESLRYDEPPAWVQPVRHALGAALLQSGRKAEAEAVFREDLRRVPGNGWALYGLSRALRQQGKKAQAKAVELQFRKAWEQADVELHSACFCLQGV
jgi:tetratricopeptide (TPR) repeat protein